MAFRAIIGSQKIKSFTKSLTCLSRFGDDVVICASSDDLCLSTTNSSKTAFCRVKFCPEYFVKYRVNVPPPPGFTFQIPTDLEERGKITGQLLVKSLLSILKHKAVEKTVDRCELSIVEGDHDHGKSNDSENEEGSLESKLIIRLHCKHGVVKTHRLLLLSPTGLFAPQCTPSPIESRVTIGPRTLKDMLEHFPQTKGTKNDPQLVWLFGVNDVKLKSVLGGDAKGKSQISTEIKMSADEFDSYDVCEPPISLAFHLREFNATIALAESLSVALDLRFTKSTAPIYIEFQMDTSDLDFLFVISTTQTLYESSPILDAHGAVNLRKHDREEDRDEGNLGRGGEAGRTLKKKPLPAAVQASFPAGSRKTPPRDMATSGPSVPPHDNADGYAPSVSETLEQPSASEPLFMPGASQLSNADMDIIRESGLGIEHMNYEEFEAMMEADGEEVGVSVAMEDGLEERGNANVPDGFHQGTEDDLQMEPTQAPTRGGGDKMFRPLFDD